ncbi:helix-turn-helix domain-containing protein [Sphingomonas sp. Leaf25]|uniref:helix-turn-helix domain-containing protein n=1 Tax=Sphingomonas sp. Leaf25 TaxID=1735692 RepID=UPI0006F9D28C|nr:DUF4019 domain-containing protein [Sphingomonas sp. Leaf25]KQN03651.1 hypothetical protein ASE78_00770 [Sphingomonas sp. Leaf25]
MREGLDTLTEREKEALRLLLAGHDAKSVAAHLNLSIHTINERLRDARRKLAVSSSREAARILGDAERGGPQTMGDKQLGVSPNAVAGASSGPPQSTRLLWLSGGMLTMSILIAAVIAAATAFNTPAPTPAATEQVASDPAGQQVARQWLTIVDQERWQDSWQAAGATFRDAVTADQWTAQVKPVRAPLGAVRSRTVQRATTTTSLPGAPAGEYQLVEFRTAFANRAGATETVVLAKDGGRWGVVGYFIK